MAKKKPQQQQQPQPQQQPQQQQQSLNKNLLDFLSKESQRGRQAEAVPAPIVNAAKAAKSFAAFKIALGLLLKSDQHSLTYLSKRVEGKDIKNVVRYIYLSARKA